MGLDGVEIVLAVEEEFGIAIDDADAANLTTPRRLVDYVFERLHGGAGDHPPDHAAERPGSRGRPRRSCPRRFPL